MALLQSIFAFLMAHRWSTLVLVLASSVVLGAFAPRRLDHSMSAWFVDDDPDLLTYERLVEEFGSDRFIAVAIELDRIAVGAAAGDGAVADTGAAYLYDWDGAAWVEDKVFASDGAAGDGYGSSIALRGDRVLVGKYSGSEIKIDDVEYIILREDEVLAVIG